MSTWHHRTCSTYTVHWVVVRIAHRSQATGQPISSNPTSTTIVRASPDWAMLVYFTCGQAAKHKSGELLKVALHLQRGKQWTLEKTCRSLLLPSLPLLLALALYLQALACHLMILWSVCNATLMPFQLLSCPDNWCVRQASMVTVGFMESLSAKPKSKPQNRNQRCGSWAYDVYFRGEAWKGFCLQPWVWKEVKETRFVTGFYSELCRESVTPIAQCINTTLCSFHNPTIPGGLHIYEQKVGFHSPTDFQRLHSGILCHW